MCPGYKAEMNRYSDELYHPPEDKLNKNETNLTNEIRKELEVAFESI